MKPTPLVYVGLDYDCQEDNLAFARELSQKVNLEGFGFKVNLDSVANFSPEAMNPHSFIKEISSYGKPVFIDMKMWNGGRTMCNVAEGCASLDVDIINMYPHAGGKFLRKVASVLEGSKTKLFGLTVLTHYTDEYTQRIYGKNLSDTVKMLADISYDNGANGLVLPGTQLETVRDIAMLKLCPGIRPTWYGDKKANVQEQIVTPSEAVVGGADCIVISSPIRKSTNRPEALEKVLMEVRESLR